MTSVKGHCNFMEHKYDFGNVKDIARMQFLLARQIFIFIQKIDLYIDVDCLNYYLCLMKSFKYKCRLIDTI